MKPAGVPPQQEVPSYSAAPERIASEDLLESWKRLESYHPMGNGLMEIHGIFNKSPAMFQVEIKVLLRTGTS